jgi:hypothetical protein
MKLSEAIRAGAKIRPQCHGGLFQIDGGEIKSCALGAALEGAGLYTPSEEEILASTTLLNKWSELGGGDYLCPSPRHPSEDTEEFHLEILIEHLNDVHRWTRERIADWLEEKGY